MQDRPEAVLPLHLNGGTCADHTDDVGVDPRHRTQDIDLHLRNAHVGSVETLRLAHLIQTEEVKDHFGVFRCFDSFGEKHCVLFSVSEIAAAHRFDFQLSLSPDQFLHGLHFRGIDHGRACALIARQESKITDHGDFCSGL